MIGGRMSRMFQFAQRSASKMKALHEELVDATRDRYQRSLTRGLGDGFVKRDYTHMISGTQSFALPRLDSLALRCRRLELHGLRRIMDGLAPRVGRKRLLNSVSEVVSLAPKAWNPARQVARIIDSPLVPYCDQEAEVILYLIPASRPIDWSSPRGVMAAIQNYMIPGAKHYIGHAAIELRVGNETVALTAMTGETNIRVIKELIFDGLGLSFLSGTFPGRLMDAEEVHADLAEHFESRRIAFLRLTTSCQKLDEVLGFIDRWADLGAYRRYGLWAEADLDTGAGCSAFAIEVLRRVDSTVAGLFDPCLRDIRLPRPWLGCRQSGHRVPLSKLLKLTLFSDTPTRWAHENEEHHLIRFWDPDLMVEQLEELNQTKLHGAISEQYRRGVGVTIDTHEVASRLSA